MRAVKIHLLVAVLATQAAALLVDCRVPYFPIEISRTAASGPVALFLFRAGVLTLPLTALYAGCARLQFWALWVSLLVIALYDDLRWHGMHMFGVTLLAVVFAVLARDAGPQGIHIFTIAGYLYAARLVLRFGVVLFFETPDNATVSLTTLVQAGFHTLTVLLVGAPACKAPAITIAAFRLSGILQWLSFAVLSELLV